MDSQAPIHGTFLAVGEALLADLPLSMVLTDPSLPDNPIVYVNRAFEQLTGYAASHAIGRNCRFLQGEETEPDLVTEVREGIRGHDTICVTMTNYRLDGTPFRNRLMIAPVRDHEDQIYAFVGIQMVIGEDLPDPAPQNVVPYDERLSEMHHRVKNHLQMISSMIRLQSRDSNPRESYRKLSRRVDAVALLYDEFQAPPRVGETRYDVVSAGSYVSRVASTVASLDARRNVRVGVDTDPVYMRTERAAQVGLVTSEILSNTLKHAFEGRPEGIVTVSLREHGGDRIRLMVSDDGVGMGGTDWPKEGNLGASIVRSLIEALDAQLGVITSEAGTIVTLDFVNAVDTSLEDDGTRILADAGGNRAGSDDGKLSLPRAE